MKIVFATNNLHKLQEVRQILGDSFEVLSLKDIGCDVDIPETGQSLEENALQKARYVFDNYHIDCFADDTGLEVEALGGAPGVYSARYADGVGHDSQANMKKLLTELENEENRKARFRTVIALIIDGKITTFEGIVDGEIIRSKRGGEGFGYDPIFQPEGYNKTFAEIGYEVKNQISHRARAVTKLANWLKRL
jgi:non-canonical purine NTP pyrophosphatase (RdgB/HAM1 family)